MTSALSLLLERNIKKSIGIPGITSSKFAEHFARLPVEHAKPEHVALILYPSTRIDTERRCEHAFYGMRVPDIL